jgi:hypothetical protein
MLSKFARIIRVVLSDVLGGKDVIEERDERTDASDSYRTYSCKKKLHVQIRFYILSLVLIVG